MIGETKHEFCNNYHAGETCDSYLKHIFKTDKFPLPNKREYAEMLSNEFVELKDLSQNMMNQWADDVGFGDMKVGHRNIDKYVKKIKRQLKILEAGSRRGHSV